MKVELNSLGELHIYAENGLESYAISQWFDDNLGVSVCPEKGTVNLVVHGCVVSDEARILKEQAVE